MRLWSVSPDYLDTKGLCGVWAEANLAKNVLLGLTKGYKQHPQLERFKQLDYKSSIWAIETYLFYIYQEANKRGYKFDINKINTNIYPMPYPSKLTVTRGQLEFEFEHLQKKLWTRNIEQRSLNFTERYADFEGFVDKGIKPHPLFEVIDGDIEPFERIN